MTIDPVTAHFTHMVPLSIVSLSYTDHVDDDGVQMMRSEDIELKPIILVSDLIADTIVFFEIGDIVGMVVLHDEFEMDALDVS